MNMIIIFKNDFVDENEVILEDERARHVKNVLRSKVGDTLVVGTLNKNMGRGCVKAIDSDRVSITVTFDHKPPDASPITLVLALPRPIVLNRMLMHITTLGIKHIHLIHSQRVEKSYWSSPVLQEEKLQQQFILGLQQAKDTMLPEIYLHKRFKPFVEDELPLICDGADKILAHPKGVAVPSVQKSNKIVVVVGPEGGFIPYEIEKFEEVGFQTVSLGERILRVETAVPVLVSKLIT